MKRYSSRLPTITLMASAGIFRGSASRFAGPSFMSLRQGISGHPCSPPQPEGICGAVDRAYAVRPPVAISPSLQRPLPAAPDSKRMSTEPCARPANQAGDTWRRPLPQIRHPDAPRSTTSVGFREEDHALSFVHLDCRQKSTPPFRQLTGDRRDPLKHGVVGDELDNRQNAIGSPKTESRVSLWRGRRW